MKKKLVKRSALTLAASSYSALLSDIKQRIAHPIVQTCINGKEELS